LATPGERLALCRLHFTGPNDTIGYEIDTLQLLEVDAHGRLTANVVFDADDRRAAAAEMRDRFARGMRGPSDAFRFLRAVNDRDLRGCERHCRTTSS
jgi:hypothetical protein